MELATRLPARADIEHLEFFACDRLIADPAALLHGARIRGSGFVRAQGAFRAWRALRSSVVHAPNYFLPNHVRSGVVTVHDLSVFRYPDAHPPERVRAFEQRFWNSVGRADHLITDSETTRSEVIKFTGIAADRMTAVPLGVSETFRPLSSEQRTSVLKRHGLPLSGYGLTISSLEPRKRIDALLSAWRMLPAAFRQRWPLVIAGAAGWNNEELHEQIENAVREGWAILLGYVSEADLPALYSGASLFVYPSAYEGFGLPPLEAMACGAPTIVADASCLPEVTRGAALLADVEDVVAFSDIIRRGIEDDQWRKAAISAGIQVAALYSWDRCVDATVAVYQHVNHIRGDHAGH
jgi:alpha-1,3-rhamnosyl/mannosyltransferase